jgi:hypothetical protein
VIAALAALAALAGAAALPLALWALAVVCRVVARTIRP